jgi:hypothetical protein
MNKLINEEIHKWLEYAVLGILNLQIKAQGMALPDLARRTVERQRAFIVSQAEEAARCLPAEYHRYEHRTLH